MKTFAHRRPIRDANGSKVGEYDAPVSRVTVAPLGGQFGSDKRKRLVVTLQAGDVIAMRPERTGRTLTITAVDAYRYLLRLAASRVVLEKARATKVRRQDQRERQRIARADAKLRKEVRSQ